MYRNAITNSTTKKCSSCRHIITKEGFIRKGKEWKTCNTCSMNGYLARATESRRLDEDLYRSMGDLYIKQALGQELYVPEPTPQSAFQQLCAFEQQQFEQRQLEEQQRLYLLERVQAEQFLSHQQYNDQIPGQLPMLQQQVFCEEPSDWFLGESDLDTLLQDYELLDGGNFYSDFRTEEEVQADYDSDAVLGPQGKEVDFEECLEKVLSAQLRDDTATGRPDSMFLENQTVQVHPAYHFNTTANIEGVGLAYVQVQDVPAPVGTHQVPAPASTKQTRKPRKAAPACLHTFFADFIPAQDILRQPSCIFTSSLTGLPLATHLVSQLSLAIRLCEVHRRWNRMKRADWHKEVQLLIRLENDEHITPWEPLSDWFVIYELGLEEVLEQDSAASRSATDRKFAKERMVRKVKAELQQMATQLIGQTTEALFETLKQMSGSTEEEVKADLDRQLKLVQSKVREDCKVSGCLGLKSVVSGLNKEKFSTSWKQDAVEVETPHV
ncbi:hypothetical protein N0V94_005679 [Neodidymelliopsis sp. IMI 364377]|nr:hypothetical protein N0V94_005679 [Neodidymelliopsis sp. IMI 364377]